MKFKTVLISSLVLCQTPLAIVAMESPKEILHYDATTLLEIRETSTKRPFFIDVLKKPNPPKPETMAQLVPLEQLTMPINEYGDTLLHEAIRSDDSQAASYWFEVFYLAGIDIATILNAKNETPFMLHQERSEELNVQRKNYPSADLARNIVAQGCIWCLFHQETIDAFLTRK